MNSDLPIVALSLLVKLTFVFALVLGVVLTMRRLEPRWRVQICRMAFLGVPLLIIGSLASPAISLGLFSEAKAPPVSSGGKVSSNLSSALFPTPPAAPLPKAAPTEIQFSQGIELPAKATTLPDFSWFLLLSVIWIGGTTASLIIESVQWLKIRKLVRDAVPVNPALERKWEETANSFGLSHERIRVLQSPSDTSSPFLFPGKNLTLIVPSKLEELLTETEIEDVFRHEAAHAANHDSHWMTAARLLNSVLWFHPLSRWLALEHLVACEEAADAAAARMGDASHYQQALAQAALKLMPVSAGVPSLIRRSRVIHRLRRVHDNSALNPPSRPAILIALILLLAVCLISGNISLAQNEDPITAPAPAPVEAKPVPDNIELELTTDEQERVNEADQLALRSKQLLLEELLKEAREKVVHSLDILPESPLTAERRNAYLNLLDQINTRLKENGDLPPTDQPPQGQFDPSILKTLIIPSVDFQSVSLRDALEQLEAISVDIDPKGVGAPIRLMVDDEAAKTQITLRLTNVPLTEALRYTSSLASLEFEANHEGVIVFSPVSRKPSQLLYTNAYPVSLSFFPPGVGAKEFLEQIGIEFGTGASAVFNRSNLTLIMRNTEAENQKLERSLNVISSSSDPNDLWYHAFLLIKAAEESEQDGETGQAWQKMAFALPIFRYLSIRFPDYQKELVQARIKICEERITELQFGLSRDDLPKSAQAPAPDLWPSEVKGSTLPKTPIPPELADSVLKISGVTVERSNDKKSAELDVEIVSHYPQKVSAEKMNLQVKIFDLSNGNELAPGKGNIIVKYPTAPYDWETGQDEQVIITYEISPDDPTATNREYYGYVIELYHDDVLQYVVASPSKLVRLTQ